MTSPKKGPGTTCVVTGYDKGTDKQAITGVFQDLTVTECQFKAAQAAKGARQEVADTRSGVYAKQLDADHRDKGAVYQELMTSYINMTGRHSQADVEHGVAGQRGAKVLGAGSAYPTGPATIDLTTAPVGPKDNSQTIQLTLP